MFSSYSELLVESLQFNLPHLYSASPSGVTPFEFCRDLRQQKTRVPGLLCGAVCMILCLAISVKHRLVTDRHTTMAYTTLAWRRIVKIQDSELTILKINNT